MNLNYYRIPTYFQAQMDGRRIFFAMTDHQLYGEDIEGPPRKEDVIIPIAWEENGGEVKTDEVHRERLLSLDNFELEILRD